MIHDPLARLFKLKKKCLLMNLDQRKGKHFIYTLSILIIIIILSDFHYSFQCNLCNNKSKVSLEHFKMLADFSLFMNTRVINLSKQQKQQKYKSFVIHEMLMLSS